MSLLCNGLAGMYKKDCKLILVQHVSRIEMQALHKIIAIYHRPALNMTKIARTKMGVYIQ